MQTTIPQNRWTVLGLNFIVHRPTNNPLHCVHCHRYDLTWFKSTALLLHLVTLPDLSISPICDWVPQGKGSFLVDVGTVWDPDCNSIVAWFDNFKLERNSLSMRYNCFGEKLSPLPATIIHDQVIEIVGKTAIEGRVRINLNRVPINILEESTTGKNIIFLIFSDRFLSGTVMISCSFFNLLDQINLQIINTVHTFLLVLFYHCVELTPQLMDDYCQLSFRLAQQRHQMRFHLTILLSHFYN